MNLKILKDTPPWDWPEDADKMFLDVLRNDRSDESDRLLAAELAGDFTVVNDELVDVLLSILNNGGMSQDLRKKAALSLGPILEHADTDGFDDPEDVPITEDTFLMIKESLQKLYMDTAVPKNVRRRILEASVRAPEDWHQNAIRAAYASGDADWKLTAVFSMRWVGGFDHEMLLVDLTNSDDGDVVDAAYEAMAMAESAAEFENLDDNGDDIDQFF
jgi:hypothetical protein